MFPQNVVESAARDTFAVARVEGRSAESFGGGVPGIPDAERQATIGELTPYYLAYAAHELRWAQSSVRSYTYDLRWIVRAIGDLPPGALRMPHVFALKAETAERGLGPARVRRLLNGLKGFLKFCRLSLGIETIDPKEIRLPRIPKREVVYLTPEEVRQFVAAIPLYRNGRIVDLRWLCFRALVEVLLATGMRISEALSLTRAQINFTTGEASIVGKGNKQRTVFFNARALGWVKEYVNRRQDSGERLFAIRRGGPMSQELVSRRFKSVRRRAGILKPVTPHILRHTVATTLLFNGCPIGHIKEILGHELLETTCKFYLGVDKRAAKEAHLKYLTYEPQRPEERDVPGFNNV